MRSLMSIRGLADMRRIAVLVLLITWLSACSEPWTLFPGDALAGNDKLPPAVWEKVPEVVQLETKPEDPHSVNIWTAGIGPDLYVVGSSRGTKWTANIDANPTVRVRIGQDIYRLRAVAVTDQAERDRVAAAYVAKYEQDPEDNYVMTGKVFRLDR